MPRVARLPHRSAVLVAGLAAALIVAAPAQAAPAKRATVTKQGGGVTATVSYVQGGEGSMKTYRDLRLTVRAKGRTPLASVPLRSSSRESWITRPKITVTDVTGDGLADAIVDVYTGGAHCCSVSAVARSAKRGWKKPVNRNWADLGYKLLDLGGSPLPEFVAIDSRFTTAYTSYAASRAPVRFFSLGGGGTFVDVTRRYPDAIRADAAGHEQAWNAAPGVSADDPFVRAEAGRGAAVAWIADLLLLGDTQRAAEVVAAAKARGDFDGYADPSGGSVDLAAALGADLKRWGYITDPTLIGLGSAS